MLKHFWWCKRRNAAADAAADYDDDDDDEDNNDDVNANKEEEEKESMSKMKFIKLALRTKYFWITFSLFVLHAFTGSAIIQLFDMLIIYRLNEMAPNDSNLLTPKTVYFYSNVCKVAGSITLILLTVVLRRRKIITSIALITSALSFVLFIVLVQQQQYIYAQAICIFFYFALALGYDKNLHIICSEIFAAKYRIFLTGVINFTSALVHALIFQYFQQLLYAVPVVYIFYIFTGCTILSVIIITTILPETCNFNMRH